MQGEDVPHPLTVGNHLIELPVGHNPAVLIDISLTLELCVDDQVTVDGLVVLPLEPLDDVLVDLFPEILELLLIHLHLLVRITPQGHVVAIVDLHIYSYLLISVMTAFMPLWTSIAFSALSTVPY